ncbi:MAG: HD domain-containing protein [Candidatus Thorarchaeota archaeon]|nr:HD domain-containing protein [Candidatus Thorarchaeota archaeon]
MTFSRSFSDEDLSILLRIQDFVRTAHAHSDSHDYSHVFTVCKYATDIAKNIPQEVDPFITIAGALLHDIGKTTRHFSHLHGLLGATLTEEFLDALRIDTEIRDAVCRVVVRHTPTSNIPPESPEEKVVYDADTLDRLGLMGLLRGFVGKRGSMDQILTKYMEKRKMDYDKLNYDYSRKVGDSMQSELMDFILLIEYRLAKRMASIENVVSEIV